MKTVLVATLIAALGTTFASNCSAADAFTDLGNGTTRQASTGLVWMTNPTNIPQATNMRGAEGFVAELNSGRHGLTDGSKTGEWRLPTAEEMVKLVRDSADAEETSVAVKFLPDGKSRAYIGTPAGRFKSARSVDGQGFPLVLQWRQDAGYGSTHYIWPVKK